MNFSNVVICQASFILFVPNENPVKEEGKKNKKGQKLRRKVRVVVKIGQHRNYAKIPYFGFKTHLF